MEIKMDQNKLATMMLTMQNLVDEIDRLKDELEKAQAEKEMDSDILCGVIGELVQDRDKLLPANRELFNRVVELSEENEVLKQENASFAAQICDLKYPGTKSTSAYEDLTSFSVALSLVDIYHQGDL